MPALPVVVAADILVAALSKVDPELLLFPAVPPATGHDATDVVGVFVRSVTDQDFALFVSNDILTEVAVTLERLDWSFDERDRAITTLSSLAAQSGGAVVETTPHGIQLPQMTQAASSAVACCASEALGALNRPRVAIVDDTTAKDVREVTPRNIPWPKDAPVMVMSAGRYRALVEKARLTMRQNRPPRK